MKSTHFEIEEVDIVNLCNDDGDQNTEGWVNVGPFAVFISHNPGVALQLEIHPRGAEHGNGIVKAHCSTKRVLEEGGVDPDTERSR